MSTITLIDSVDMSRPMYGSGGAAVVASALRGLGGRLAVVGVTSNEIDHPVGRWSILKLYGEKVNFFPVISERELEKKVAKNLSFTLQLRLYQEAITSQAPGTVITQDYMVMWWLATRSDFDFKIFYYPGLGNQFAIGRKPRIGKLLAPLYYQVQFSRLRKMDLVVAAASTDEIDSYARRWAGRLHGLRIHQLPTAVDVDFFAPSDDVTRLRREYGLHEDRVYFTFVGRLARVKGIDFLLDSLRAYIDSYGPASLLVVGDGEERSALRQYAIDRGLDDQTVFFGNIPPEQVRNIVNCADVCVVGSHFEGFSCAMVEQAACGKPLVSTDVSGANEIIEHGRNGFIVSERDARTFAEFLDKALTLPDPGSLSREIAVTRYSERVIWDRFLALAKSAGASV